MKIFAAILLASLLTAGISFALGTPQTNVQTEIIGVTVNYISLLNAPSAASVSLAANIPGATRYGRSVLTQAQGAGLVYTQNDGLHKIVAQAVHDSGNASNDMLISCSVDDLQPAILVSNGQDTGPQDLWTGITAGGYDSALTWTFDGSIAGTQHGSYNWTITFTAMEQ